MVVGRRWWWLELESSINPLEGGSSFQLAASQLLVGFLLFKVIDVDLVVTLLGWNLVLPMRMGGD